jgi:hypothetical protein
MCVCVFESFLKGGEPCHVGLGPVGMEVQDSLAIVAIYAYPVILRQVDGRWTHVGSCMVPGIMNGEMVRRARYLGHGMVMERYHVH